MIKYKNYTADNKEYDTILGIPMAEALKVLTIYKESANGKFKPKDYIMGFEDGYNRAYDEIEKQMQEITKIELEK